TANEYRRVQSAPDQGGAPDARDWAGVAGLWPCHSCCAALVVEWWLRDAWNWYGNRADQGDCRSRFGSRRRSPLVLYASRRNAGRQPVAFRALVLLGDQTLYLCRCRRPDAVRVRYAGDRAIVSA